MVGLLSISKTPYRGGAVIPPPPPPTATTNDTVFNSADKAATISLSTNLLTATAGAPPADQCVRAKDPVLANEKKHFSFTITAFTNAGVIAVGVGNLNASLSGYLGQDANSAGTFGGGGTLGNAGVIGNNDLFTPGCIVDVEIDRVSNMYWSRVIPPGQSPGYWNQNVAANPATNVGGYSISFITGNLYPMVCLKDPSDQVTANFGDLPWPATPSTGFSAIPKNVVPPPPVGGSTDEPGDPTFVVNLPVRQVQTTGTINTGSTQLTVASATGFVQGDPIIVEVGWESGFGAKNTTGVGGRWAAVPSGSGYEGSFFIGQQMPKALMARINGISGNVLSLSVAASAGTVNGVANVYLDNARILNENFSPGFGNYVSSTGHTAKFVFPSGDFAGSDRLVLGGTANCVITGQGEAITTLVCPLGTLGWQILNQSNGCKIRQFTIHGNFRGDHGWGISQYVENNLFNSSFPGYYGIVGGVHTTADDTIIHHVNTIDALSRAFGMQYCSRVHLYNCGIKINYVIPEYIQWQVECADCPNSGHLIEDIFIDSAFMTSGFEFFSATGLTVNRLTGFNFAISLNDGAGTFSDCQITIHNNAMWNGGDGSQTYGHYQGVFQANENNNRHQHDAEPIILNNMVIIQEGYQWNGVGNWTAIKNAPTQTGIRIIGGRCEFQAGGGTQADTQGALAVDAGNVYVDGLIVTGTANPNGYNLNIRTPGGTVKNSTAHRILAGVNGSGNVYDVFQIG